MKERECGCDLLLSSSDSNMFFVSNLMFANTKVT